MECCSAFMDDDPPFVGWDDADAATVVGTSCPLPGSIILVAPLKTGENNPTIFLRFCKVGVEDWQFYHECFPAAWGCGLREATGSLRVDGDGRLGMRPLQAFLWSPGQPHGDVAATDGFVAGRASHLGVRRLQAFLWSPGRPLRMRRLRAFLLRSFLTQRHFLYKLGEK